MEPTNQNAPGTFASRFAELLQEKNGGNQSECSRVLRCTPQAVNKWLAGLQAPKAKRLDDLALWLGTTPAYLMFGEGPKAPPAPPPLEYELEWVQQVGEKTLLTEYRRSTDLGKKQLLASAGHVEKLPAAALPAKPKSGLN